MVRSAATSATELTEIVLGFVNTHDHLGRVSDRFVDRASLAEWFATQRSSAPEAVVVTVADVAEAREIRDALIEVLLTHADGSAAESDLIAAEQALSRATQRYPLHAHITRGGAELRSAQPGLAGAFGAVLAAVVELAQSGAWQRVKACRNCHHGFVDQSRNASAGFCCAKCKSQVGMRSFRSRQRDIGAN